MSPEERVRAVLDSWGTISFDATEGEWNRLEAAIAAAIRSTIAEETGHGS